jgi:hypothetical protein
VKSQWVEVVVVVEINFSKLLGQMTTWQEKFKKFWRLSINSPPALPLKKKKKAIFHQWSSLPAAVLALCFGWA